MKVQIGQTWRHMHEQSISTIKSFGKNGGGTIALFEDHPNMPCMSLVFFGGAFHPEFEYCWELISNAPVTTVHADCSNGISEDLTSSRILKLEQEVAALRGEVEKLKPKSTFDERLAALESYAWIKMNEKL